MRSRGRSARRRAHLPHEPKIRGRGAPRPGGGRAEARSPSVTGVARADLTKDPAQVAAMFDEVAARYDRMNALMTGGQEARWRRLTVAAVDPRPGERVLDLAAGTATSSAALASGGARVVACDFSLGMLRVGAQRQAPLVGRGALSLVAGDALALPFAGGTFDAVTASFGLRNVADLDHALTELRRVARPGGRLVVCETSHPGVAPLRAGHALFLRTVLPGLARPFSSDPDAYDYLADSTLAWPEPAPLAQRLQAAGWRDVAWRPLTLGVVALHRATA